MLPTLAQPALHFWRFSREFAELIGRVGAHRRSARIARAKDGARELYHRLAIRHFQCQDNVVVASCHIGSEQLSAQFFGHAFRGFKSFVSLFRFLGTLFSPV
jgi:hypothetical protein